MVKRGYSPFTSFIIKIAIVATTISVAVMLLSTFIIKGFQKSVTNRFYETMGHIHITPYLPDPSHFNEYATFPVDINLLHKLSKLSYVNQVCTYSIQSGLLKSKEESEGIFCKGVHENYFHTGFEKNIVSGRIPNFWDTLQNEILISTLVANKLQVKLNGSLIFYSMVSTQPQPKARKVKVVGLFETGIEEFDKNFSICNIVLIRKIQDQELNAIQGYELFLNTSQNIDAISDNLFKNYLEEPLRAYPIKKRFESVFNWLEMMKMNERIIMIIMLIVAVINMTTALLILILERTRMIAILKSIGMKQLSIQKIFITHILIITLIGILLGNIVAFILALLQYYFGFIHLDKSTYYVSQIPIYFDFWMIVFINVITFLFAAILLILPTIVIKKMNIVKAIKFS